MTELPPRLSPKALAQRNELIGIYRAAQARLQKQLTGAALSDFQQFRIGEQLKQIDAVVAALDASLADLAPSIIPAFYRHGTDLAGHALKVQGVAVGALNLGNQIHTGGVAAVADQMALDLYNSHQSIAATSKDILRKTQQSILEERQINRLIGQGLVEGQTPRDATQRLTKALKDRLAAGQLVKAGGKHFTPETYAELVVLTRTREAVTAGAINRGLEYGVTLYQISITSTACPVCVPYQGKIYSIVPDDRFPLLVERPPYHPRCTHAAMAYVEIPTDDGKAEMEALSDLSKSADPIAPNQAGYQEAIRVATKTGGNRITKTEAKALAATTKTPAGRKRAVPPEKRTPADSLLEYEEREKGAVSLSWDDYMAIVAPLREGLPKTIQKAIGDYTGNGYVQIDDVLRNKNLASYRERFGATYAKGLQERIDTLLDLRQFVTDRPLKVYRGIGKTAADAFFGENGTRTVGVVMQDSGLSSYSTSRSVAENFASAYGYVIEATLPAGTRFIPGSIQEQEIILPPGASLKVVDIRTEKAPNYQGEVRFLRGIFR